MDDNLYDEFGNYIGTDLESVSDHPSDNENEWLDDDHINNTNENQSNQNHHNADINNENQNNLDINITSTSIDNKIILHEDKNYYPSASYVYPNAEILIEEEDTQPLETPIIAPIKNILYEDIESQLPDTNFTFEYLTGLMDHPLLIRNICLIGNLSAGKTLLTDLFIQTTHIKDYDLAKEYKYTDTRKDEQQRGISIKAMPLSLVLPILNGKSYLINSIDTPGHTNFVDEQVVSMRLCDGAVIVIDAAEGCMIHTEKSIRNALHAGLSIIVVINKIDRLFLELKLPPDDAYHKLCQTLEDVNNAIDKVQFGAKRMDPASGNVVFSSAKYGFCFSLESFAKKYTDFYGGVNYKEFAKRLWGNKYYCSTTRKFLNKPDASAKKRTFVHFILEPVYKIFSHVLSCESKALAPILDELSVQIKPSDYHLDAMPLLKLILSKYFGDTAPLIQAVVDNIPPPNHAAATKIPLIYTGDSNTEVAQSMISCDNSSSAPLMLHIAKLIPRPDASAFDSLGRIFSGTVKIGDMVRVMGEGYSLDDEEDMAVKQITKIWIFNSRYRVEVNQVKAGNIALFEGIDATINKTATVASTSNHSEVYIFRPLQFNTKSVVKIAVEPINPAELPKMLEGLRKLNKSYPLLTTKVEESGEHIILCTGEMYADCVLHDLRKMYSADSEIKVSDPVVTFCETVSETSSIWCFAQTPNKKNKLTMLAEPLQTVLIYIHFIFYIRVSLMILKMK